jgi:hypothetical protein
LRRLLWERLDALTGGAMFSSIARLDSTSRKAGRSRGYLLAAQKLYLEVLCVLRTRCRKNAGCSCARSRDPFQMGATTGLSKAPVLGCANLQVMF